MDKKLKKYNKIIGIDISESDIFAVELHQDKGNLLLSNVFSLHISAFDNVNKTIQYINQSVKSSNIKTRDVVVGLSMQYFKLFPVPIPANIPEDEIRSIIAQEGNIDNVNDCFTYVPLNSTYRQDTDGVSRYDVLGISVKKNIINAVRKIFGSCGLNVVLVTPSFYAISYFLNARSGNNIVATLSVSQLKSELVFWSGRDPIYENLFLTHQFTDQTFQSISYIQNQLPGTNVAGIYTLGSYLDNVNFSALPYTVTQIQLPDFVQKNPNIQNILSIGEIVCPFALALLGSNSHEITLPNLLASEEKRVFSKIMSPLFKSKNLDPSISKLVLPAVMIFVISIISSLYIKKFLIPGIEQDKSNLSYKANLAETHLNRVLNFEKTNKVLHLKTNYFSSLVEKRILWSKILREIADVTPSSLWIDRLDVRNKNIDIIGRALTVDSVANFSINLNYNAKLLENAQIISLRKFQEESVDFVEFQVSVEVENSNKAST